MQKDNSLPKKPRKVKVPKIPRMLLSVSSVETFQSCNAKWYYRYVEKLPSPKNYYSTTGSFIHKILEVFIRHLNKYKNLTSASSFAFMIAQKDEELKLTLTPEIIKEGKAWLDFIVERFRNDPSLIPSVHKVELPFVFKIPETNISIRGFIDRIDVLGPNKLKVIDYKTSSNPSYLKPFQLITYAIATKHKFPNNDVEVAYQLIRHDFSMKEFSFNEQDEKNVIDTFIKVASQIETLKVKQPSTAWTPTPTKLCDYCPYRIKCQDDRAKKSPWKV